MPAIVLVFLEQQATELLWILYRRQHIPLLTFKTLTLSLQLWSFKPKHFEKESLFLILCQLSCAHLFVSILLCNYFCAIALVPTFWCQCSHANLDIVLMLFLCQCYSCSDAILVLMLFLYWRCWCANIAIVPTLLLLMFLLCWCCSSADFNPMLMLFLCQWNCADIDLIRRLLQLTLLL